MNGVHTYTRPVRGREQIAEIVGCRMVDGACVTHQPHEPRQRGCPFVDSVWREAGPRGVDLTDDPRGEGRESAGQPAGQRQGRATER